MNAPADLFKVNASTPDAVHGYKSYTLGAFTFRRDEYFAHLGWTTNDGRPLSHTMDVANFLRAQGLKLGLVSNTGRNLDEFVAHHRLNVDAALGSGAFGRTKPHPTIFRAVLERLEVEPADAAMVGDSIEDDIEGARATGIPRAFLLDREGRYPEVPERLPDLLALPAALGLPPS